MDELQTIVAVNHNELIFPVWSNSGDYETTAEKIGAIRVHPEEEVRVSSSRIVC